MVESSSNVCGAVCPAAAAAVPSNNRNTNRSFTSSNSVPVPAPLPESRRPSLRRFSSLACRRRRAPNESKLSRGCGAPRCTRAHPLPEPPRVPQRAGRHPRLNTTERTDSAPGLFRPQLKGPLQMGTRFLEFALLPEQRPQPKKRVKGGRIESQSLTETRLGTVQVGRKIGQSPAQAVCLRQVWIQRKSAVHF